MTANYCLLLLSVPSDTKKMCAAANDAAERRAEFARHGKPIRSTDADLAFFEKNVRPDGG
jgi:hypothetical protein